MLHAIIIAITTVFIGALLQKSSKHLAIVYNNTNMEIPTLLVVAGGVMLIALQLWLIKMAFKNWLMNKKLINSIKYCKKSIFLLMAGDLRLAEKAAKRINPMPPFIWLGSLIATIAAKQQRNWDNCHEYILQTEVLMQQYKSTFKDPNELAAIGLLKVELSYQQQEYQKCIYELKKLYRNFPKYRPLLWKLIEVYKATNDWEELVKLLPSIKKHKLYLLKDYQNFEINTQVNRMTQLATTEPVESLIKAFNDLPKSLQRNSKLFVAYINGLLKLNAQTLAEKQLKDYLSYKHADWEPKLIFIYSSINAGENINSKIKVMESWLARRQQDHNLLLALGEACIRAELYGKAKNYLEKSLSIYTDPACYLHLGKLAGIMGNQSQSLMLYQQGLSEGNNR